MQLLKSLFFIGVLSVGTIYVVVYVSRTGKEFGRETIRNAYEHPEDFEGFDNVSGTSNGCYIVPNVVHFIRFDQPDFSFIDAVCVLAAFKNQKPDRIFFHANTNFTGKYWQVVRNVVKEKMTLVKTEAPTKVFGQQLSRRFRNFHAGDVARLRVLMEYGGIYVDNDSYIVRSLDDFRRYEITIGWREKGNISNQVIIAHKNARFLREWLATYDHYNPSSWFYNAGIRPTQEVLLRRPELVHRVTKKLAEFGNIGPLIYKSRSFAWREHYAIHLLIRHQQALLQRKPVVYNERNIKYHNIALKEMAYDVYPF